MGVQREDWRPKHPRQPRRLSRRGLPRDSSVERGEPSSFPLGGVIKGWTEGLQLMVEGEKRRFWIPEKLAYKGRKGSPAGMLVFDVELLEILN